MLSPRLLAVFAIIATLAAAGAVPTNKPDIPKPITTITEEEVDDTPWFSFPLFGNLFAPLWRLLPSFGQIGPKIVADDDKFQVAVHVKEFDKKDLKVKVKGDFIHIQGSHEAKHEDRDVFASQFFHTYSMPLNSSADDVTADLSSDGYLVVTAPLNGPNLRSKDKVEDREVPIKETGTPYLKEEVTTTVSKVEPTTEKLPAPTTEKDREQTTPSNFDAATDKDNVIPHGGNEIIP